MLCQVYTHRVGAREIISTHHLHVGFLYEGNPQLISVARVGAEQLAIAVHWKVIINDHLNRKNVRESFDINK